MRLRLSLLLGVAACACFSAVAVAGARADRFVPPTVIPAIPFSELDAHRCPIPGEYRSAFVSAAAETGLPLALLTAVAQVESRFDATAESAAGARGLLQLMPRTAAELDLDLDEPESNVLGGARYLRRMVERFHSTDLALAAYVAGPTAVSEAGAAPNEQAVAYATNVTKIWRILHGCA